MRAKRLGREFYARGALVVARGLLGKRLVVPSAGGARVSGDVVETEAYVGPEDRASHAFGGRRTARTETMYARGGTVYVFLVYGMHHQFNVVAASEGVPQAVLVRALEPAEGVELMRERRGTGEDRRLTSGPGKLCRALAIDRSYNGEDLLGRRVWVEDVGRAVRDEDVSTGPRVGIDYAGDYVSKPWRFWLTGNPFVSRRA